MSKWALVGLAAFVIFTVGLNLGLHGIITLHDVPNGSSRYQMVGAPNGKVADSVGVQVLAHGSQSQSSSDLRVAKTDETKDPKVIKTKSKGSSTRAGEDHHKTSPPPPPKVVRDANEAVGSVVRGAIDNGKKNGHGAENTAGKGELNLKESAPSHHISARSLVDEASQSTGYLSAVQAVVDHVGNENQHITSRDDISSYVAGGGKIPIVMMTCNRAELLKRTLASLFSVKGVTKSNVVVLQDGKNVQVSAVVREHGLKLEQHDPPPQYQTADGATRIATHYKYALSKAFELFPLAPAVIVVEDDLLFSPDFLDYFEQVAPILDVDESSFLVSAWSDNGYKGKVDDPYALRRTEFFPGLGWLLPRRLYLGELEAKWPTAHWDHWLRSDPINRGREIIYPQVPRTFHNGIRGTFMDMGTHNRYFRDIAYNLNRGLSWKADHAPVSISSTSSVSVGAGARARAGLAVSAPVYVEAIAPVYEERVLALVTQCRHIKKAEELVGATGILCIWLDLAPDGQFGSRPPFQPIAEFFGIWHEHQRGVHKGLHEFYFGPGAAQYILLLNLYSVAGPPRRRSRRHGGGQFALSSPHADAGDSTGSKLSARNYGYLKPADVTVLSAGEFSQSLRQRIVEASRSSDMEKLGVTLIAASSTDMSCDDVCATKGRHCKQDLLYLANTCAALRSLFACMKGCHDSIGAEQPAVVDDAAPSGHTKGVCLYSSNIATSTCEAKHKYTRRACVCGV